MRLTVHKLREGVDFHIITDEDLAKGPHGQFVAAAGRRVSRKDKALALARFRRCCEVREILQRF